MHTSARLSDRFRDCRERQGFDLDGLTVRTKIQRRYLEAIEQGAFSVLPKSKAYRMAYIKEYARALGMNAEASARQFVQEDGLEGTATVHPKNGIRLFPFASLSIAFRNFLVGSCGVLFVGYLLWQVHGILQPPRLDVYSPIEGSLVSSIATTIAGQTDTETALTVNGQTITLNDHGTFTSKIDLADGLNTIVIEATKKHGKTSTIVRHVIAHAPRPASPVSLKDSSGNDKVGL